MQHALQHTLARCLVALLLPVAALISGCASSDSIIPPPVRANPLPQPMDVEPAVTGAIFRKHMTSGSLFSDRRRPHKIGDALKIDIAENLSASSELSTDTSRATTLASKGPGSNSNSLGGILKGIMNIDASASGSDTYKGSGNTESSNKFSGRLAAAVINVQSNGYLVVAGERSIAFNSGISTLRFSGVVNPLDITNGNVVASSDVVDARLELVGRGDVSDAASRSWIQKILAKSLSFW
ncbi:flagellar L-ring protein precursor FlgH [Rhodoferax sp. OV413]|uniref:flagellar basal body L-ring protein FlgH n=1 Tax=Rhodoferax sp. OV413 TaxID=1855285 RepID=UPI00088E4E50|nr:flagellar basal body L-ring protein FlgH [Rhodoferax sp. OV413]SDO65327.1 flagellar L-ring protein precursor FlgH [Rhodoferax sp. OV413]